MSELIAIAVTYHIDVINVQEHRLKILTLNITNLEMEGHSYLHQL